MPPNWWVVFGLGRTIYKLNACWGAIALGFPECGDPYNRCVPHEDPGGCAHGIVTGNVGSHKCGLLSQGGPRVCLCESPPLKRAKDNSFWTAVDYCRDHAMTLPFPDGSSALCWVDDAKHGPL